MELQKTKHEIKLAQWRRQIADCRSSGMQVRQWCQGHGISPSTYYRWQRQVWEVGVAQVKQSASQVDLAPVQQWAQLTPAPTETAVSVEIKGCRVEVRADTDRELLTQVCRLLREL